MNRLFISTKEIYAPTKKIEGAGLVIDNPTKVSLTGKNEQSGENLDAGCVMTSSLEEAKWLMMAIFRTSEVKEKIIINSIDRTIKIECGNGKEASEIVYPEMQTAIELTEI